MQDKLLKLSEFKQQGRKFSVISCYDYTSAVLSTSAGADALLIGDSAAQFVLGHTSTLPITMDFLAELTAGVCRAAGDNTLIIADLPYCSCTAGREQMLADSRRFMAIDGVDIVKIETSVQQADDVISVIQTGLPVMAHLGIRPQSGKYKAEGTTAQSGLELIKLADKLVSAGAKMLLLEGTATETAAIITSRAAIPVISCGSGTNCDGSVLVLPDIAKLHSNPVPKFSKAFGNVGDAYIAAISEFHNQTITGRFPDDAHSYHMKSGELEKLQKLL